MFMWARRWKVKGIRSLQSHTDIVAQDPEPRHALRLQPQRGVDCPVARLFILNGETLANGNRP